MFSKPTKTGGFVAILAIDRLVREFLFEGHIDHLLEIGKCLTVDEVDSLSVAVFEMDDRELRSWVAWLLQVGPQEAAHLLTVHVLREF